MKITPRENPRMQTSVGRLGSWPGHMERQQELVCDLLNGAISNNVERTLTQISRSHHFDDEYLRNGTR